MLSFEPLPYVFGAPLFFGALGGIAPRSTTKLPVLSDFPPKKTPGMIDPLELFFGLVA